MSMGDDLIFFCNGRKITERKVEPGLTLDAYLRKKLRLSGTKQGCRMGGCGACTVMVSSVDPQTRAISHKSVLSCLMPVCLLHGKAVTTVEGIGSTRTRLHAVQERLAKSHGSQCGFCSPGMVMSMYTLIRNNPMPDVKQILRYLEGNLCRCTGYRSILDGFKSFCGENCCQVTGGTCQSEQKSDQMLQPDGVELTAYDPTQEPIFPPELLTSVAEYSAQTMTFSDGQFRWIVAATLEELLQLVAENPSAQLVVGNTSMGVKCRIDKLEFPLVLSPGSGVQELTQVTNFASGVMVGSGATISQLEDHLTQLVQDLPEHQTRSAAALLEMIGVFAGQQVRNMASIGGSLANPSGLLDLSIVLMAMRTRVTLAKAGGKRRNIPLDQEFYPQRGKSVIGQDEIIQSIHIPFTDQRDYVFCHKVAQRHSNCRSAVSCGFRVTFEPEGHKVKDLCLVFGGVDANPAVATQTCNSLIGQPWNQSFLQDLVQSVSSEISPGPHVNGISAEYRQSLLSTCLLRFYVQVSKLIDNQEGLTGSFAQGQLSDPSLPASYSTDGPVSTQIYQPPPQDQPEADPLGRPIVHRAALQQCSGEAAFCDDIPLVEGELYTALVVSTRPHAKIICVNASAALALPGVVAYLNHRDVQGSNWLKLGTELFATEEVHTVGQPIGAIVATSHNLAVKAARLVHVQYEDLQPVILTIQEAIKEGSFLDEETQYNYGDLEGSFQEADGILEGEFEVGGQEHFYMETHACVVKPGEDDEIEMYASYQNLTGLQKAVSGVLGVSRNRIVCLSKRLGGGFGGKNDYHLHYLACAVAAKKLRRPTRLRLERSTDMLVTGGRHPFHAKYRVGYRSDGRVLAADIRLYSDGGYMDSLTKYVMLQAMQTVDSFYHFPGFRVTGRSCRTNKPSNTAFRGFGNPQSLATIEHIMSEVADVCGVPQRKVRDVNFKPEGSTMVEGARPMDMDIFKECWDTCLRLSDYEKRLLEINKFNRENMWKKRGLAIIPTKHGVGSSTDQGSALVHIYTDGSVLVNHGGIEMGQGLYTKLVQVASRVLEIPVSRISASTTATDKCPNTNCTGGSIGADLFGGAVKAACEILKERLVPYKMADPKGSWDKWVQAAYFDRVSLSTTGHYKRDGVKYDEATNTGNHVAYYTMGVGVSEVEIDCLTGEHQLLRTDIVMDIGKSLNPAIDIGQIEGGFVQGYGYFTMEEIMFTKEGALLNDGASSYKIPTAGDIPKEFNVTLLRNMRTPEGHLYSSKGIGEPPFFLGAAVFFAIRHALLSSRQDNRQSGRFKFNPPATVANVRMTCGDLPAESLNTA